MPVVLEKFGSRLWRAHQGFQTHEGTLSAASIAYYIALSFFPLLLVLVAGLAAVLAWTQTGQDAQHELLHTIEQQASPDLAQQVGRMLNAVKERAPAGGPIGFVVLVASAIAIFAQLDAAFNRIWTLSTNPHATWRDWVVQLVYQRLKSLGMLIGLGGFIIVVMITSMVWSGVEHSLESQVKIAWWMRWATSLTTNVMLSWGALTLLYRVIPKPEILWRDAVRGGLLGAVLWEAGRQALAAYILHLNYPTAYGIIGSFIAVMLWAYYASLVILFGAEYVRVLGDERSGGSPQDAAATIDAANRS